MINCIALDICFGNLLCHWWKARLFLRIITNADNFASTSSAYLFVEICLRAEQKHLYYIIFQK